MSPVVHPPVRLIPRARDEMLDKEELATLILFRRLKKLPPVDRFPGSTVLRRFSPGSLITRQGDAGGTAFYILSASDLCALREHQIGVLTAAMKQMTDRDLVQSRVRELRDELDKLPSPDQSPGNPIRVATVFLLDAFGAKPRAKGWFSRLVGRKPDGERAAQTVPAQAIPNDGPSDFDAESRQAALHEGDVFGEMSCMTFAPRSGTVVADCDCYVLELNRPILDHCQKDEGYRKWMDQIYEKRVLSSHLRQLKLFEDLSKSELNSIRGQLKLETVEAGTVVFDQGDPSDCVYIIRNGLVQVVIGIDDQIKAEDIGDWPAFCQQLLDLSKPAAAKKQDPQAATKPSQGEFQRPSTPRHVADQVKSKPADVVKAEAPSSVTAPSKSSSEPTSSGRLSVAELLAKARHGSTSPKDAPSDAEGPVERTTTSASDRVAPEVADKPATSKPSPPAGKKLSAADILAAAKSKPRATSDPRTAGLKPAGNAASPDPKAMLAKARAKRQTALGSPHEKLWSLFANESREAVVRVAAAGAPESGDIELILAELRDAMRCREFLSSPEIVQPLSSQLAQAAIGSFPKGLKGIDRLWSDVELRVAGRVVLHELFPDFVPRRQPPTGPPRTLAYLGRGECIGELGVLANEPRNATCIAYDHPPDESGRQSGRVELVKIEAHVFESLIAQSPVLREKVRTLAAARTEMRDQVIASDPWESSSSLLATPEFRDSGFVQGQSLLVVDLDKCTNCGDCISACINTHEDGRSRLFLDGPRFNRFLVPSACRNCLNPSCMIGCPVGSIVRGDNGQIEIKDWCIGCKQCAEQCPYDSIQMHDEGVIPGADKLQLGNIRGLTDKHHRVGPLAPGWLWMPASLARPGWQRSLADDNWLQGIGPFRWDLDIRDALALKVPSTWTTALSVAEAICFRYRFGTPAGITGERKLQVSVVADGLDVQVWVNGTALPEQTVAQRKKGVYEATFPASFLHRHRNVIAAQVGPDPTISTVRDYNSVLFSLRMDIVPERYLPDVVNEAEVGDEDGVEVKLITERAVVCDLCSSLSSQQPACVAQCPHDAAIRIEARKEFDTLVSRS